jgi:hypothetical protein
VTSHICMNGYVMLVLPKAMVTSQLPTSTFPTDVNLIIKDLGLQGEALAYIWHAT